MMGSSVGKSDVNKGNKICGVMVNTMRGGLGGG